MANISINRPARKSAQAGYFELLACFLFLLISAHAYSSAIYPRKHSFAGRLAFAWASPAWGIPVSSLFGL